MSAQAPAAKPRTGVVIFVAVAAAVSILILLFVRIPGGGRYLSPSSTAPNGTRALAQLLGSYGVEVTEIHPSKALAMAGPDTTIVVDPDSYLDEALIEDLIDTRATIVLITNLQSDEWGFSGYIDSARETFPRASCADGDAQAADRIGPIRNVYIPLEGVDATACFPLTPDFIEADGFAWVQHPDNPQISFIADPAFLTNEFLAEAGNAAFAIRKLASQPTLYWVYGHSASPSGEPNLWIGLPDWFFPAFGAAALSMAWWVAYRGRRFGKLVAEPLPVVVPASETNEGRAILYQRGNNYAHAAQVLRAGTIARMARGRGIPAGASAEDVISTFAGISGYPPHAVADLLYHRPITGDGDLIELATELTRFERDLNVK